MHKGGVKEAAKMLQGLNLGERKKLMDEMEKKDPRLYSLIRQSMVSFDDLIYLNQRMMGELLRQVSAEVIGLALRGANKNLMDHFVSLVSKNVAADIMDVLQGKPRMVSDVEEAQEVIMSFVRSKVETGEFVLTASDKDEYV